MSKVQTTISFKSRKLRYASSKCKEEKYQNENKDYNNTAINAVGNLKRRKSSTQSEEESCSPTKISKHLTDHNEIDHITSQTKREDPLKPLTSREAEIQKLENFLNDHLISGESASLYISGQPGTGKTASLSYILQLPQVKQGFKHVYVNCTAVKSAGSIYMKICNELQLKPSGSSEKACLTALDKYLSSKHKMTLLVLDEIDQLDSKRQSVLYTIFEWASRDDSRLVLIGVANALDLTQRALPRLQARCSRRPLTMHFQPYTKQQIIDIFKDKISQEDNTNLFSPVALQMLAAKIAAISGDMRRALDIGRRVVELARRNKFKENQSLDSIMNDSSVTVEIKQVLEVLNEVYGGSTKINEEVDDVFPLQQKLILCSLMLMLTKGKNKNIVVGKLYDVYKRVANRRNISPLDMSEFSSACTLLETRGAVRFRAGAGGAIRARRVQLQWDESELGAALRDRNLLSSILNDVVCLSN